MMPGRHVGDAERRARLAVRHGLARPGPFRDVPAATRAMTVLHATEAASVHLALWARVPDIKVEDVERALYEERALVKQLAMRRTLFVFPRDLLPAAWGSAAARTAAGERRNLAKWVATGGIADDPEAWIETARTAVLRQLADGESRTTAQLREEIPELAGRFRYTTKNGKNWGGETPIAAKVPVLLGAEGLVTRGVNAGHWRLNKPTWTLTETWLGEHPPTLSQDDGYDELVRRWLWTFGPGTETDILWWLGATKTIVRRSLARLEAVEVPLDGGGTGWLLPSDLEPVATPEPWAALLPTLDPTVMGWKERSFYLDPDDVPYLFDSNGNAGNTAWWDGRIVGCWLQDDDGRVRVILRHDIGPAAVRALDREAERLTAWLDGVRITNVYASRQMKEARLP